MKNNPASKKIENFKKALIELQIMKDRNLTSHTYDFSFAEAMVDRIKSIYLSEFESLQELF